MLVHCVILSDRSASLVARIVDAEGKPRPDGQLILFPGDRGFWSDLGGVARTAGPTGEPR